MDFFAEFQFLFCFYFPKNEVIQSDIKMYCYFNKQIQRRISAFFQTSHMQDTQNAPSLSQAQRIKKLSQEGQCSYEAIFDIMGEEKKAEMDRVTIKNDVLRKYFPKSYTPKQVEDTILKLLEKWQKKRQRSQER